MFLALPLPAQDAAGFQKDVAPLLAKHCAMCHNATVKSAGLNLDAYKNPQAALRERDLWEKVREKVVTGQMPPRGLPRPAPAAVQALDSWIEAHLKRIDRDRKPDPGRVTARRLNRAEYNNTIRDLLGIDARPADDFPVDDTGYGFDNNGDVLSLSPVLMEKYMAAAERIAREAIVTGPPPAPSMERLDSERLGEAVEITGEVEGQPLSAQGAISTRHRFAYGGEYELKVALRGVLAAEAPARKLALLWNGVPVQVFDVLPGQGKRRVFDARLTVAAGRGWLTAAFVDDGSIPPRTATLDPAKPPLFVDSIEIRGPYNPAAAPEPESHKRIFVCGHAAGSHEDACGRTVVSNLARRAFRRPVSDAEVGRLLRLLDLARQDGASFEEAMRLVVEAVLVSPHFLFRIERDPPGGGVRALNDFELASRLSYFLWSSMPDEELLSLAGQQALRRPEVLEAQVSRMIADPKSSAFVENFAGQWLELRNLNEVKPDAKRFPEFDESLRAAMRRETLQFFEHVLREDRSLLDFLDGRYSFLNERLAKHYGVEGVRGSQFRKVELDGTQRSGLLTQASILTVSSYPTRTSPVLRGLWVLENFLGAPPPPPPDGVPPLNEEEVGTRGTLRQQLERHRADPGCAVCHNRMDPLGFGLENYNAIGAWRTHDGRFPVDSAGELPGGRKFQSPAELKEILKQDKDAFTRCLTEKLLTYALGRGLGSADKPVVNSISQAVAASQYRFSSLIREIVRSLPFQMRNGEGPAARSALGTTNGQASPETSPAKGGT